jgi:hypothetical protein
MMKNKILLGLLGIISLFSVSASADIYSAYTADANIYHVRSAAKGGSASNNCTATKPCLTVADAATKVTKPGSIIHVHTADGDFAENTTILLAKGVTLECDGKNVGRLYDTHVAHNENFIWMTSIGSEGVDNYQEIRNCKLDGNALNGGYGIQVQSRNNVKIHDIVMVDWLTSAIIFNGRKDNQFDLPPNVFLTGAEVYNFTISNSSSYTGSGAGAIAAGGTSGLKIHDGSVDSKVSTGRLPGGSGYLIKLSTPRGGFNKAVEIYKTTLTKKRQENFDFAIELWNSYGGNLIHDNIIEGDVDTDMCHKGEYTWCHRIYNNKIGYPTYAPLPFTVTAATWTAGTVSLTLNTDAKLTVGDVIRITGGAVPSSWINVGGVIATWDSGTKVVTFPYTTDPGTWTSGGFGGATEQGITIELDQSDIEIYGNWFRNMRIAIGFYVHNKDLETLGSSRYRYGEFGDVFIHDNFSIDAMLMMWNAPSGQPHGYNHNIQAINNTVVNFSNPEAYCGIRLPEYSMSDNIVVRNNIVQGWTQAGICLTANANITVDGLSVENNLLFGNGNSNLTKIFTPSAGQRLTNYVNQGNIIGDPLFMNFATGVVAGSFVVGNWYEIATPGTTVFTTIGASANTVGTIFKATGVGTGTGTANGRDFRIQLASPAVTTGLTSPFLFDYRGRYRGGNPDIGAIQRCNSPSNCETTNQMAIPAPFAPF